MWKFEYCGDTERFDTFDAVRDSVKEVCRDNGYYSNDEVYGLLDEIEKLELGKFVAVQNRLDNSELLRVTKEEGASEFKVFQMNEYDWVVAKSEEEAIKWYEKEFGDPVDIEEVRECDLETEGQYTSFTDEKRIAELETEGLEEVLVAVDGDLYKRGFGSLMKYGGEWFVKVPFKDMLPTEETEPYITASTEC